MQRIYGSAWSSQYGAADDGTWAVGLAEFTPEQIGTGLRACLDRADRFPPSLPEFRRLCAGPRPRENAAAYVCPPRSALLPHKLTDEDRAKGRAALEAARLAVRRS